MNLFNTSLRIKGFPIKKALFSLKEILNIPESSYIDYLEREKKKIFDYHLNHNSFYKAFAKSDSYVNWESLPIMTKRDLQKPLTSRLSDGFTSKNCYVNKTSGSSGDPFVFAKDKFSHALSWAEFIEHYNWYSIDFKSSKQARFYGIPLDKKGYYKERLKDFLGKRYRFSVFDLSSNQFEKNISKFKSTAFDYINGYTSVIVQFAKYLKEKNSVLKTVCPSLKACIVTSEMLYENDKTLLQKQLGVPVINEYGSAELGLIAFENKQKEWVVNSNALYVEILDGNNKVLPYGKEGRIVITSLYNKAHPFIRYDIGDIGILSKKSTPRKPVLEKLLGRTSDIIVLPSGKKSAGLSFYYVTKSIIEDDSIVKEFIIEQIERDTFKIIYVASEKLSEEKKAIIKKKVSTYLEDGLTLIFEKRDLIKRSKSGKLKQFTCLVN